MNSEMTNEHGDNIKEGNILAQNDESLMIN